jgi:hypothetical protein
MEPPLPPLPLVQLHGTVIVTSMEVDFGWQTVQTVVVTVNPGGMEPHVGVAPTHVSVIVVVTGKRPVEQTVVYTVV